MQMIELPVPGYSMRSAARLLGFHDKTVYRIAKEGRLDTFYGVDGKLQISREELYRFIKDSKQ